MFFSQVFFCFMFTYVHVCVSDSEPFLFCALMCVNFIHCYVYKSVVTVRSLSHLYIIFFLLLSMSYVGKILL